MPQTAEQRRVYYNANKEKCLASSKAYKKRNPEKMKEIQKRYNSKNPDKIAAKAKRWKENNPIAYKNYSLKSAYGITLEEFNKLFELQGKCCAICKRMELDKNNKWCVDHCHATGNVRGILCKKCNVAIGMLDEDLICFINAIKYLRLA